MAKILIVVGGWIIYLSNPWLVARQENDKRWIFKGAKYFWIRFTIRDNYHFKKLLLIFSWLLPHGVHAVVSYYANKNKDDEVDNRIKNLRRSICYVCMVTRNSPVCKNQCIKPINWEDSSL